MEGEGGEEVELIWRGWRGRGEGVGVETGDGGGAVAEPECETDVGGGGNCESWGAVAKNELFDN